MNALTDKYVGAPEDLGFQLVDFMRITINVPRSHTKVKVIVG